MSTDGGSAQLEVQVALAEDGDARDLDDAVLALRRSLVHLDVIEVQRPAGAPAPDGARAVDAPLLGALLVTASTGGIPAVVRAIEAWLRLRSDRRVRLQLGDDAIELTGATAETERELIDAFLARHAPPPR